MCSTIPLIALLTITFTLLCNAQENIQTRIPNSLAECYEKPELLERDTRLPMNINILIELIRKVEDDPNDNRDMRQLAISLLHRFKLDGIERASGIYQSSKVLPFSPSGYQFSKHRILLSRLIPNTGSGFPNGTLTALERVCFAGIIEIVESFYENQFQFQLFFSVHSTLCFPRRSKHELGATKRYVAINWLSSELCVCLETCSREAFQSRITISVTWN